MAPSRPFPDYIPRLVDVALAETLAGLPAAMLVGPRACGKTTTARRHAATVVRLDRPLESGPFRDDPDAVLGELDEPILLDEWQLVPDVLAAVKRSIDDHGGVNRFVLTGSVRAELLEATWAATGRVVRLTQWGLTERELIGDVRAPSIFDRLFAGEAAMLRPPTPAPGLKDYIDLALRGMFPEIAITSTAPLRRRWLTAYVDQLLLRDASLVDDRRDPVRLRRYLNAVCANTAGVVEHKTLFDAAGINRETAVAYDSLFETLFLAEQVPAWHSNRLNRLTRTAKRYVTDPAIAAAVLGIDARAVLRNADLLGRLIDSSVVSQLRPEAALAESMPTLYHLRHDRGLHEIDLVAEAPDGRIVAIEIKSSAAPTSHDAVHLAWLRDRLGDAFVCGVVFHTGPRRFALGERIEALPIATIWGSS